LKRAKIGRLNVIIITTNEDDSDDDSDDDNNGDDSGDDNDDDGADNGHIDKDNI
jgi:hypothetical protein